MDAKKMLIGGNWKCNGTLAEMKTIIDNINACGEIPVASEVVIAVPAIHIFAAKAAFREEVSVSAQDCGLNAGFGAYTGEISPELLKDAGVTWTLTGHSERRMGFGMPGETSAVVAVKTAAALKTGLSVIVCIGEQLADREAGTTMTVCAE
ncbi:Triosephosphate isomerase, partial [Ochromonadaceae sp. CCMP2298]